MEMAMICTDTENNHYYSLYQFNDYTANPTEKFKNVLRRIAVLEPCGGDIYIIK
jgi:hypothetical protein